MNFWPKSDFHAVLLKSSKNKKLIKNWEDIPYKHVFRWPLANIWRFSSKNIYFFYTYSKDVGQKQNKTKQNQTKT